MPAYILTTSVGFDVNDRTFVGVGVGIVVDVVVMIHTVSLGGIGEMQKSECRSTIIIQMHILRHFNRETIKKYAN